MKIFPIGTSRLHEPLSLINPEEVLFPGVGYFHSSSQIVDWIKILRGEKNLSSDTAKFFFRKDQTPPNPFDKSLWDSTKFTKTLERKKKLFNLADVFIIEISTDRSYIFENININSNPNFLYNLSYADAMGIYGYYEKKHPTMSINKCSDNDILYRNLKYINDFLIETGKYAIILGHLVETKNPNSTRINHIKLIKESINKLENKHMKFYDSSHLVDKFGFRILEDSSVDIHHLPWKALEVQAKEMYQSLEILKKEKRKKLYLSLGENSLTDNILDRHNLKSFSTPYSSARTNLDYAIFCEKTNYRTLIDKELLVYEKRGTLNNYMPILDSIFSVNHGNGFEFTRQDIINNKAHGESIQRKIDRLISIKGKEDVTFFYHYRLNNNLNYSKIFEKATEFISFYKPLETNSKIILFSQKIIKENRERTVSYKRISSRVHNFIFHTKYIWAGNNEEVFWARNDDDLIKIMLDNVKEIE